MTESSVIRISRDLDERLDELAARTGRRKSYYASKAIESYLEDLEDYYLGLARLEESKGQRTYTLAEVERRLGLDDRIHKGRGKGPAKSRLRQSGSGKSVSASPRRKR